MGAPIIWYGQYAKILASGGLLDVNGTLLATEQWKTEVACATTANITLSGAQTVDGVALTGGERVLVKDQSTASQNGIYTVVDPGAWTRVTDLDAAAEFTRAAVYVAAGTANSGRAYVQTATVSVVDTDTVTWARFIPTGLSTDGEGLDYTGGQLSLELDGSTLTKTSSGLKITTSYLALAGGTMTGNITLAGDPSSSLHPATKQYVDSLINGLSWKEVVACATTANITLSGAQTVDGVALTGGERVLVKDQSTGSQNGIYIVVDPGAWTRATDADSDAEVEFMAVAVTGGTTNADKAFRQTAVSPVVDTDALTFAQFLSTTYTADGDGIELTGTTFSIELDGSTLTKSASGLKVTGATATEIGYLSGVTSAIQTQLDSKVDTAGDGLTITSTTMDLVLDGSTLSKSGSGLKVAGATATEIGYLSGVTSAIQTQIDAKQTALQTENAQVGTTYTLVLSDANKMVTLSNASAITMTVPPNSSVAFPVGTRIDLLQIGAGQVTVAAGGGVTVNATPSLLLRAQYSGATLWKQATDVWYLVGDLE